MSNLTEAAPAERHRHLAAQFAALIDGTTDWEVATPVKEWQAGDIVDHITTWPRQMLGAHGVELAETTGDRAEAFRAQTQNIQALLDDPETAGRVLHLGPMGDAPLAMVLDGFYSADLFMHAWDLAKATGQEVDLDQEAAAGFHAGLSAMGPGLQASGQFGEPVPVAEDASPVDRLMGLIGRDPAWTRPA
ncbi:MAG: maleylpyruvate isomerase family mycothiol-dependent enzyme [Propionibacteriaceae bacterium]|nr:maleylpyruvate isomerase family mycothiol-dependent enzyme [Propionibacteriaceae bacterium]